MLFLQYLQRDMAERGHSEESIKASIEARKPDFDAFIDPQKKKADVIIQVKTYMANLARGLTVTSLHVQGKGSNRGALCHVVLAQLVLRQNERRYLFARICRTSSNAF